MATIEQLAEAVLSNEGLEARALANEIVRSGAEISRMPEPDPRYGEKVAIMSAALVELLAEYAGVQAPSWAARWGKMPEPVNLLPAKSERLARILAAEAPEPLKRRNILAPDGFLRAV